MQGDALPADWCKLPLSRTAQPGRLGFDDGDWIETPYITDLGIRLIQTGNIGVGAFLDKPGTAKFINERSFKALGCKWVYPGDILICRMADPIGRACLVPDQVGNSVTAVDCTIYRPSSEVAATGYMLHRLNSVQHLKEAADIAGGSTRQRISRSNLGAMEIPLPPLPEQRRIATILDTLDEAIRRTEQVIEKLKQMKQGLLHDLLTRGIDDNGELRPPPDEAPHLYKDSPVGRIPREWDVEQLGTIARKSGGLIQTGPFGSQLHAHEYVPNGVPVIMPQDIQGDRIDLESIARITESKATALGRHRVRANDVVFARRGDLSRCLAVNGDEIGWICGTGCLLVRLPVSSSAEWVTSVYRHDIGQRQVLARAVGSTMVNLNGKILGTLSVPFPPINEQHLCVVRAQCLGDRLAREEAGLEKLRTLKHGLMDDLLTGRVRVATETS